MAATGIDYKKCMAIQCKKLLLWRNAIVFHVMEIACADHAVTFQIQMSSIGNNYIKSCDTAFTITLVEACKAAHIKFIKMCGMIAIACAET